MSPDTCLNLGVVNTHHTFLVFLCSISGLFGLAMENMAHANIRKWNLLDMLLKHTKKVGSGISIICRFHSFHCSLEFLTKQSQNLILTSEKNTLDWKILERIWSVLLFFYILGETLSRVYGKLVPSFSDSLSIKNNLWPAQGYNNTSFYGIQ